MADHNKGGFMQKAQKKLTRTKTKVRKNILFAQKHSTILFSILQVEKTYDMT